MLEKEWSCNFFEKIPKVNLFPSLQDAQTGVNMLMLPGEEALETTSNVLGRGANPNCSTP